jgi:predicted TIM-barrel fold metal-dependent hydrolase
LVASSDWYDREITLVDPTGFQVGDGVCLRARNPHTKSTTVLRRTLIARSASRFKLDRALRENFWLEGEATAATLFPILCGENVTNVTITDITLDGNRQHNDFLDGNYSGCVFLQDCRRICLRGVEARNNNGDGISWQICHDVVVEDCHSHDNAGLGLHPGSGSQRPIIRGNKIQRNDIGIFFCWGVRGGRAEKNTIEDNRSYGVSIGHRDTDNVVCDNRIVRSGKTGVLFRLDGSPEFAPHRNKIERNVIVDSGDNDGIGIDIRGTPHDIVLAGNTLRESRAAKARIGIRIGGAVGPVQLEANQIEGYATAIADLRKASKVFKTKIIDTHTHFYDPTRPQGVPWPGKDDKLLFRRVLPDEFKKLVKPFGVVGTIVVEASPWVEDNQWLLELAAREPFLVGVIGRLDPRTDDFAKNLHRFARNPLFRGIRLTHSELKAGLKENLVERCKLLIEHNLVLDVNGGPDMPADVAWLASELPKLRIVINHAANLRIDGKEPPSSWVKGMQAAAKHPNVFCKVSALVEQTGHKPAPQDVKYYRPVLDNLWELFGEDRLIYGSNWPVSNGAAPYETVVGIVREYFTAKRERAAAKFFLANSKTVYGWVAR